MRSKRRLPLEQLEPFLLPIPIADPSPIDWAKTFANDQPVEIEVGFGKGGWLVAAAEQHANTNYLGIEVVKALQLYAATRLAIRNLKNARVACTDARWLLANRIEPQSVAAVHVYFPDPWWKARHKKRRVFTAEFAAAVERVLIPGGRFYIASDVEEYFNVMADLIANQKCFREVHRQVTEEPRETLMTNFERKALERGGKVWRAEYVCHA